VKLLTALWPTLRWVPAPDGTFSLYLRCYWAQQPVLDGTWMPPNVEKVK
jgi:hypothetical protein